MSDFYLYTETAFHHQGDLQFLKELILASKRSGAKGVKFQVLINPSDFLSTRHSGYGSLASYCFSLDQWKEIFQLTHDENLDIILMPLDLTSLQLTMSFPVRYIDIHPVSFYDKPLLNAVKETQIPVIMGVGGRTPVEIRSAVSFFGKQLSVLMVGFQAFPSQLADVKLQRIPALRQMFPAIEIGYADHSSFNHEHAVVSNDYAYLLGATVFEKHITVTEGVERVDFSAAVSEEKINRIREHLEYLRDFVADDQQNAVFEFTPPEVRYRERQKKVVLTSELPAGTILTENHLTTKMIDREGGFYSVDDLIGRKLTTAVGKDVMLEANFLV